MPRHDKSNRLYASWIKTAAEALIMNVDSVAFSQDYSEADLNTLKEAWDTLKKMNVTLEDMDDKHCSKVAQRTIEIQKHF